MTKIKQEKRTFYCSFHKRFHRFLWKSSPSMTYQKCLMNGFAIKFKSDMTNTELFKLNFKSKWSQEKANYNRGN